MIVVTILPQKGDTEHVIEIYYSHHVYYGNQRF